MNSNKAVNATSNMSKKASNMAKSSMEAYNSQSPAMKIVFTEYESMCFLLKETITFTSKRFFVFNIAIKYLILLSITNYFILFHILEWYF